VAIIGCGRRLSGKEGFGIAYAHAAAWRVVDPECRLYAVDIDPGNLADFGDRFGLPDGDRFLSTEALYAATTPRYVNVCTWPTLHAPMVIEAARSGVRGILCEKPMALASGDIRAMLAACDEEGSRLGVAHQVRYNPRVDVVRRLLAEGRLGDGLVLEARLGDDWDVLSYGVHWFDLANYLFDAVPAWVLAGLAYSGQRRYQHAVEDGSVALAQYPGNRQALFVIGPTNPPGHDFTIRGSEGLLRFSEGAPVELFSKRGYEVIAADDPVRPENDFSALMRGLVAATEGDAEFRCDAHACSTATEMAFAVQESARTLSRIALPSGVDTLPLERVRAGGGADD
jgi:predicted dehydrogenase